MKTHHPKEQRLIHDSMTEKSKLAITEVVKEDSGVYSCEAHNKLGFVALSSLKINVKGKLVLLLCLKKHESILIKKYISE